MIASIDYEQCSSSLAIHSFRLIGFFFDVLGFQVPITVRCSGCYAAKKGGCVLSFCQSLLLLSFSNSLIPWSTGNSCPSRGTSEGRNLTCIDSDIKTHTIAIRYAPRPAR